MLTFAQFLSEEVHSHWGFLRNKKKSLVKTGPHSDHFSMARRMGFTGTQGALRQGHVRFFHHAKGDHFNNQPLEHSRAGYEFHDSPEARKLVANHLRRSGGFREIYFDTHPHGSTKYDSDQIKAHHFHSTEDALKHLDQ